MLCAVCQEAPITIATELRARDQGQKWQVQCDWNDLVGPLIPKGY